MAHTFYPDVFPLGTQEGNFFSSPLEKRSDYYAFGLTMPGRSSNSANPNDHYKFTGYEQDDEAGLTMYHANARGYDPVLGRFNQIDPLSDQFPGWTPYHYVHNNPMNLVDPTGMSACDPPDDCSWKDRIASWFSKPESQRQEDFGGQQQRAVMQNQEGIQEGAEIAHEALNKAGEAGVGTVKTAGDVVNAGATVVAAGGVLAAPFTEGASLVAVTAPALTVATIAEGVATGASALEVALYDGNSSELQARTLSFGATLTINGLTNKAASTFIRVAEQGASAMRSFVPVSQRFVTSTHAVRDATNVVLPVFVNKTINQ